jgi:WD40 repeat protein
MSPDHTRLMTAGSDQTVKIWRVFGESKNKNNKRESILKEQQNIR